MRDSASIGVAPLLARAEALGHELRSVLEPMLSAVAGTPIRSIRVTRAIGIDKSLASRLVRAVGTESDLEFLYLVPSPTGLRILADRATGAVRPEMISDLRAAADRFQQLLDSTPEGRVAIETLIAESSPEIRSKREHSAKQASFKSMSFILGHYCEMLTTALFLVPAENGQTIDGIEIQRRIGLRRLRPSAPLPLLSLHIAPEDEPEEGSIWVESVERGLGATTPSAFLAAEYSSPLPDLTVVEDDSTTTFVLGPHPEGATPSLVTSSFRIRNGWPRKPEAGWMSVRGYILSEPSRAVVRDLFVAESLLTGATPEISFNLPGPPFGSLYPPRKDGEPPHFSSVKLTAAIEQRPAGRPAYDIRGVVDQAAAVRHVLGVAGHADTRFHGWRVRLTYPVPLIEMGWWLNVR